jgi:hypothetical protein
MNPESHGDRFYRMICRKAPSYVRLIEAQSDDEFDNAFDELLARVIARMEENKSWLSKLDEECITEHLAMGLMIPGLTVNRERHSNGHVDVTIEADHSTPIRKKLGEAKIYNGYAYHVGGLEQLLTRYSTGRECRGLLIVYFKKENLLGLVEKLRHEMDERLPCAQQGKSSDYAERWWFLTSHAHDTGQRLPVAHVICNLYHASPTSAS